MVTYWKADQFISTLNRCLCVEPDGIRIKNSDERRGQGLLPLFPAKTLVFRKDVDLVIEGPCADFLLGEPTEDFPMGKCAKVVGRESEPDRSWLHTIIGETEAKNILVFAECCGSYPESYQNRLRRIFPDIVWLFPKHVPDLCRNLWRDDYLMRLIQCLMNNSLVTAKAR